jgi:hypothetical protein
MPGFEPGASTSRTWRAAKLRYIPFRGGSVPQAGRSAGGGVGAARLAAEEEAQVGLGLEGGEGEDLVGGFERAGVGAGHNLVAADHGDHGGAGGEVELGRAAAEADTAVSTPHWSVNSQVFLGLLTLATTRGTAYQRLTSRLTTRLSSSSPVAATTVSTESRPRRSSTDGSQASPATTVRPPEALARLAVAASCSTTTTSWPASTRWSAM